MENRQLMPRNQRTVESVFTSNEPMPPPKGSAFEFAKIEMEKSDESDNLGTIIAGENGARRNVDGDISSWRIEGG